MALQTLIQQAFLACVAITVGARRTTYPIACWVCCLGKGKWNEMKLIPVDTFQGYNKQRQLKEQTARLVEMLTYKKCHTGITG